MIQVIRKLGSSAFITGILVVVVMLSILELVWLVFGASVMWSVLVSWVFIALLPFVIRIASLCCSLPSKHNVLPH